MPFGKLAARPCIFEYVYFARPDSVVHGKSVYAVRKAMGAQLASESAVDADVVIPVPDSGVPAALGFAQSSGMPYELGIIRNHYVGRTFIQPTQSIREFGVRMKHSANRAVVEGKRIILIDDSIVRGTTSIKIVQMMRILVPPKFTSGFTVHQSNFPTSTVSILRNETIYSLQPTPSKRCAILLVAIHWRFYRSTASIAQWVRMVETKLNHNSPIIALRAITRLV